MTTTRTAIQNIPRASRTITITNPARRSFRTRTFSSPVTTTARNMSLFPRYLGYPSYDSSDSLTPFFRLLDDFDTFRQVAPQANRANSQLAKTFNPKFDVKETENAYELHGELAGVEQKDVEIEFTDQQTLSIKGRSERSYQKGTPPDRLLGQGQEQGKITEGGEHKPRKASVADESEEQQKELGQVEVSGNKEKEEPTEKFWVSERSVGEFARSFHFPSKVDQEGVKASMKNGILSIHVPKAREVKGGKRITIS